MRGCTRRARRLRRAHALVVSLHFFEEALTARVLEHDPDVPIGLYDFVEPDDMRMADGLLETGTITRTRSAHGLDVQSVAWHGIGLDRP